MNAVTTRKASLQLAKPARQRNEAAAFDRHFDRYERRPRKFFKEGRPSWQRKIMDCVELEDGSTTNDAQLIHDNRTSHWRILFLQDENGFETPPN